MNHPLSTTFTYTRDEYLHAMRRHYKSVLQWKRDMVGGVLAIAVGLCLAFATDLAWIAWGLVGAGAILLAMVAYAMLLLPRLIYASQPKLKNEYTLTFDDDGIHFKTDGIDATLQWTLYHAWLSDDRFYIMYHGKRDLSVIPRRALADAQADDTLRQLLTANIGEARSK